MYIHSLLNHGYLEWGFGSLPHPRWLRGLVGRSPGTVGQVALNSLCADQARPELLLERLTGEMIESGLNVSDGVTERAWLLLLPLCYEGINLCCG